MSESDEARAALEKLVVNFTEAFNREDIDEVMSYFAEGALYDELNDVRHVGADAIRAAFIPQFSGKYGRMRFHTEDLFLDVEAGKALIRWVLTMEEDTRQGAYRGLDILHFENGKLVEKHTYCKAKIPFIHKKADMEQEGKWPLP
ncbi:MAG: nuclear transport factor 2 family protein [Rhodospirillaceae bacterium]|jgi:ketosteroid isomerase-like protein|nr:nuclear transport factor 2 family protein [Rhodospirillaceae bacterium]MBT5455375.1 nuclear transport factor 2 family protein [Rhodospirillaceae bacterium]